MVQYLLFHPHMYEQVRLLFANQFEGKYLHSKIIRKNEIEKDKGAIGTNSSSSNKY